MEPISFFYFFSSLLLYISATSLIRLKHDLNQNHVKQREEWTFVVLSLCGFLNNVDVGKPLWRRDKSLSRVCCDLYSCLFIFMLVL
jgi:hypothetical protein